MMNKEILEKIAQILDVLDSEGKAKDLIKELLLIIEQ